MTAKCKRHGHVTLPYSILFLISVLNLSYFSPTHPVVLHFLLPHLYHILKLPALSYVCSLSIVNIQLVQTDINPMFLGWLVRCLRTQSCFHKDRTSKAECHIQPWYDHKKSLLMALMKGLILVNLSKTLLKSIFALIQHTSLLLITTDTKEDCYSQVLRKITYRNVNLSQ